MRTRALVFCAFGTLVISGCGGSVSGVAPAAYVRSVCGTLAEWKSDVQTATLRLRASARTTKSLAEGKQQYVQFVALLRAATARAAGELSAAGAPAVKQGQQRATMLVEAFERTTTLLGQAVTESASLPTTSTEAFKQSANALVQTVRSSTSGIEPGLEGLKDADLEKAAANEPACKSLAT